jgi:hypothetical protein
MLPMVIRRAGCSREPNSSKDDLRFVLMPRIVSRQALIFFSTAHKELKKRVQNWAPERY